MKAKFLLTSLFITCLFFTTTMLAQSSIGIPVQGIARDVNGTARINTQIDLTFDLYYIEGGNEVPLYSPSQIETLTTDNFGVFSTIVNTSGRRPIFANRAVFLRILESGTIISDEQLNSVPYAIAADNGVPTGAIMPFVGTTAPEGWLLCDGSVIPSGQEFDELRLLTGNNVPDLRGLFLRGAGNNSIITTLNAALGSYHGDTFASHQHSARAFDGNGNPISGQSLVTNSTGSHSHSISINRSPRVGASGTGQAVADYVANNENTGSAGNHSHTIDGNTAFTGQGETRPDHYGVNYIIKL